MPHSYNLYEKAPLVAEFTLADAIETGRVKTPVIMPVFLRASTLDALIADTAVTPPPALLPNASICQLPDWGWGI